MFCTRCGTQLGETFRYCSDCGLATSQPRVEEPVRRITRWPTDKMIAGVCSGFAHYFGIDPTLVRLLWVASVFVGGAGLIAYLICWIVVPMEQPTVRATPMTSAT